jgi:hypothetical protein
MIQLVIRSCIRYIGCFQDTATYCVGGYGIYRYTSVLCTFTYSMEQILKKLTGFQLVKKFPAFYGNRRFITAFTNARHQSLSWGRSIQSEPLHRKYWMIHLNIILSSTPGSSKWPLSLRFPHQNPVYVSPLPHTYYVPRPSYLITRTILGKEYRWVTGSNKTLSNCLKGSSMICTHH